MKQTFITLLLIFFGSIAKAQDYTLPLDPTAHKVSYSGISDAPGSTKKALFDKAKKWVLTRNSQTNPYTITFENESEGTVTGKGTFMLAGDRRNYVVQFAINISTKEGKYKYDLTDFIIQYKTEAAYHSGGYGMWSHTTHTDAENLEYSLETFYPSRLDSRKPSIKWYEEITKKSFLQISQTMQTITGSLKQSMSSKTDW